VLEQYRREKIEDERLEYAWTGDLGHWYWEYKTNRVTFNPLKVTTLGYALEEVPAYVDYQYFTDKLHPEDFEMAMTAMREHLAGRQAVYEAEYRIKTKGGQWRWYRDIGKITQRDESGRPMLVAGIVFDVTQRKELQLQLEEQNKQLELLANTDGLTKLLNRRTVFSKLEEEVSRACRYQTALSIGLMDIDHFKRINDSYGHLVGDKVLVEVAATIKQEIRTIDYAGRYGGEEFLVVFPNTAVEDAQVAVERIRERISQLTFGNELKITLSGGLKAYQGETVEEFVNLADRRLYQAKASGRNRIEA
jgi:diguanylate cyclase